MMDKDLKKYFDVNKDTWNKKVAIHSKSEFYDNTAFLSGKSSLNSYELNEIGDVKGKSLLHLQCHFGQDTLSWSRMGAKCTGIDLSDKGIEEARLLNDKLNLDAEFVVSNVYDVPKNVSGQFDIVFTSYGVIGWLPDLDLWASIIAEKLSPGGTFYMVEFHPIVWMFDFLNSPAELRFKYMKSDVIYEEYKGTYTNSDADIVSKDYTWTHGLGEVVSALTKVGLEIEFLHEFEQSPYDCLPDMKESSDGMFVLKQYEKLFPLIYSVKATKK